MTEMSSSSIFCPAKVNLFLEVHDMRPDGYHNLGTLFQTLDIGDTLYAELDDHLSLTGAEAVTPDPESNLVIRAARLVLAEASMQAEPRRPSAPGLRFRLDKTLPAGAGLGGGSSDAAGALQLANQLWDLGIPTARLAELAIQLGADIPFFLLGGCAFGEGKGERLKPAPEPYPFHIVVATPKAAVETAWAYRNLEANRKREWERFKAMYHFMNEDPGFYRMLRNDFEAPMLRHFAPIAELHSRLETHGPVKVMLSGSGASLFALFTQAEQAQNALADVLPLTRYQSMAHFLT